jgi:amidase
VPVLFKDYGPKVAGLPLTHGALPFLQKDLVPDTEDSHLAADFRSAGFSFLGRANTIMGGVFIPTHDPDVYSVARNPWNPDYCSGGSSSGSAAAVAANIVPIAHGNDGGGSIRMPASLCGTIGFKPTRARVSMGPGRTETSSISSAWGVDFALTKSVRDTHALLNHVQGWRPGDAIPMVAEAIPARSELTKRPLRIGLATTAFMAGIDTDPECVRAAEETALLLERLGHTVEKVEPPRYDLFGQEWDYGSPAGPAYASLARKVDRWAKQLGRDLTAADLGPQLYVAAELGKTYTARHVEEFGEVMGRFVYDWDCWWVSSGLDLLLSPTVARTAPHMDECLPPPHGSFVIPDDNPLAGSVILLPLIPFTQAMNWTGQPAVSLPLFTSSTGLPLGSQLAAARMRDDLLIQIAYEIEEAVPWNNGLRPTVSA